MDFSFSFGNRHRHGTGSNRIPRSASVFPFHLWIDARLEGAAVNTLILGGC